MSEPEKNNTLQVVGIAAAAVVTVGLLGMVLFGGSSDPGPSSSTGSSTPSRMPHRRTVGPEQRVRFDRASTTEESEAREPVAGKPLVAQLKGNRASQLVAQLRSPNARLVAQPVVPLEGAASPSSPGTATLAKEDIQAAVRQVLPAAKRCYEGALKMKPDSRGKVTVSFTLEASDGGGAMTGAEIVSSDLGNPVADACLLDAFASARFPVPHGEGQVRVTYPIMLEPGDSAP